MSPAARFVQSGDDVYVDVEVPSTKPEDIAVEVPDDTLVVWKARHDRCPEGEKVPSTRCAPAPSAVSSKLGTRIDAEAVEADYRDGNPADRSALVAAHRPSRVEVRVGTTPTEAEAATRLGG